MDNFIVVVTYLLIGMGLRKTPAFPQETGNVLNLFVIYVSLPALILLNIPNLVISNDLIILAVMPWGMLLFSCASILLLSKLFAWDRATTGCLLLLIPLGNTSFLGIPMVEAFFGVEAIPYAVLYDQLGSFLALAIYGSLIIALYSAEEKQPSIGSVIKKILSFPPFIALMVAFLLKPLLTYPPLAINILEVLAATLVPVVMIAVGFQLTLRLNTTVLSQLSIGLTFKLILAPVVALVSCKFIGLEGDIVNVSIFEAGMPPMISAGALAILANLSPILAAALVGLGIMLSFVTLPLLYQLIT